MRSKPDSTIKLILKEVGADRGSGYAKLDKKGNIAVEQLIKIAEKNMDKMNAYTLKNAVKEAAGACVPMGVIVEGMHPKEFCKKVDEGAYDSEIKEKKTTVSEEKKKVLAEQLKKAQEEVSGDFAELKKKLEAKAQKDAQKAAAAPGAAPAPGAAKPAGKTPAKKE